MSQHVESSPTRRRWAIAENAPLIWKSWDDAEYIVYCTASGDTHLINEVTAEVLRQLELSELALSDLAGKVAKTLGTERDGQFETHVEGLLVYLDQIGLVEPVS